MAQRTKEVSEALLRLLESKLVGVTSEMYFGDLVAYQSIVERTSV